MTNKNSHLSLNIAGGLTSIQDITLHSKYSKSNLYCFFLLTNAGQMGIHDAATTQKTVSVDC